MEQPRAHASRWTLPAVSYLLFLCLVALPGQEVLAALAGHWQGTLSFRGDDLAIRLHLVSSGKSSTGLTASVDIPELMMAWQPASLSGNQGNLQLEFPLGIGDLALEDRGATLHVEKKLGDDTLVLSLHRDDTPPLEQEDVTFGHGGIHLAGRIVTPLGPGPFPAVILVHGSGKLGRGSWSYASRADYLARLGYAVLFYDKRGTGESSPTEHDPDLKDLEEDLLAGVSFLAGRDDIDSRRLGLLGWSQGSWLSMKVAAQSSDIAFVILGSAAAVTPGQQEMQKVEAGMRDDGMDEEQIQDALAYYGLYFHVARTGRGWDCLAAAMQDAEGFTWFTYVDQPRQLEDLAWWHANHDFQPRSYLPHIKVPVLALYGGGDWMTPPAANAALLEDLIRSGGNEDVTVAVFPRADHRVELPMGPDENGRWRWPRIAPAMLETVTAWLQDRDRQAGAQARTRSALWSDLPPHLPLVH